MVPFLTCVAILSYLFAAFALSTLAKGGTDIQIILAGVFATCGTVAAAGAGIIYRLPRQETEEEKYVRGLREQASATVPEELRHA